MIWNPAVEPCLLSSSDGREGMNRMWYTYLRTGIAAVLHDERGDLSTYLVQGILALAALSLTGVVMVTFTGAGQKCLGTLTLNSTVLPSSRPSVPT